MAEEAPHNLEFYWRPGCPFSAVLHRRLRTRGVTMREINIWEDTAAAAQVRAITGGDETVPTVVVGPVAMVNPPVNTVLDAVREHAPHLLPEPDGDGAAVTSGRRPGPLRLLTRWWERRRDNRI